MQAKTQKSNDGMLLFSKQQSDMLQRREKCLFVSCVQFYRLLKLFYHQYIQRRPTKAVEGLGTIWWNGLLVHDFLPNCMIFFHLSPNLVSIIRTGCSRLLEFKKKNIIGCLIETFSKYPDKVV